MSKKAFIDDSRSQGITINWEKARKLYRKISKNRKNRQPVKKIRFDISDGDGKMSEERAEEIRRIVENLLRPYGLKYNSKFMRG